MKWHIRWFKNIQKKAWDKNISLLNSLKNDKIIYNKIGNEKLNKMFDLNYHTKKIDLIFNRVFK